MVIHVKIQTHDNTKSLYLQTLTLTLIHVAEVLLKCPCNIFS